MSAFTQPLTTAYPGAKIAEGATIHESCRIGSDVEISAEVVLEPDVLICKNVTISGKVTIQRAAKIREFTTLLGPLHIGEHAIIGPLGVIGLVQADNDCRETHIMESCRIGRCVQILAGVQVGRHARIRADSVVFGDVPNYGLAAQNPAVLEHYACPKCGGQLSVIRALRGAIDTHCEGCGAGEYLFANQFWVDAFNRVLLPNHTFGAYVPTLGSDPGWCDEKEMGDL